MSSVTLENILAQINQLPLSEREQLRVMLVGYRRDGAESLKNTLWGMAPAVETQKPEPWARKWRKIHWALAAGGALLQ